MTLVCPYVYPDLGKFCVEVYILNTDILLVDRIDLEKNKRIPGADPGFQVRGGGRTKKNCDERREARTFLGYFV